MVRSGIAAAARAMMAGDAIWQGIYPAEYVVRRFGVIWG